MTGSLVRQIASTRAQQYVAKIPAAVSGARGHDQTFSVAVALVHGFALSESEAWPILLGYGAMCSPPWSIEELRHKLASAGKLTRHPKPRGHLLANGAGPIPIVRRQGAEPAKVRQFLGRVKIREGLDQPSAIPSPKDVPKQDPQPQVVRPAAPVRVVSVPAGRCPVCWTKWARCLRIGICICTGDVIPGNRLSRFQIGEPKNFATGELLGLSATELDRRHIAATKGGGQ